MADDPIKGTGQMVKDTGAGAFTRTARLKAERAAASRSDEPTPTPSKDSYDVRKEAEKHAAKLGHELTGWTNAVDGVKDFWKAECVNCGMGFHARWRILQGEPFPEFGSGDARAYLKACAGQPSADTKGAGRFAAVE